MKRLTKKIEAMKEMVWTNRAKLKFDPLPLDEIAKGEFDAGVTFAVDIYMPVVEYLILAMRQAKSDAGWATAQDQLHLAHNCSTTAMRTLEKAIYDVEERLGLR